MPGSHTNREKKLFWLFLEIKWRRGWEFPGACSFLNPYELSLASLLSFSIHLRLIMTQSQAMLSLKRLKAGALPGYATSA